MPPPSQPRKLTPTQANPRAHGYLIFPSSQLLRSSTQLLPFPDSLGPTGPYATWWLNPFDFFSQQHDKVENYPAWSHLELKE
ncbi:hypothetical protein ARMGADRAFT_1010540 [Armillaria gallica]|uniref:Uncharacterized protein n=1 Tax=Armillaria gallica TaxID=47427 RepID=A0A2H3DT36_ARMGA|nr:hypothetical protein ARMGADRAFT_1010540 [Armillaria gallica]